MYPRCCRINFGFYSSTLVDKEAFYSSTLVDKEAKKPDTKCPAKNIGSMSNNVGDNLNQ